MGKAAGYNDPKEIARRQEVGRRIESARDKLGISKTELARRVGVSAPTYSAWIRGDHSLSSKNFAKLVEVTGEPASFFNPETLRDPNSLDRVCRELGMVIGNARARRLLAIPPSFLRKELDAIIGSFIVEHDSPERSAEPAPGVHNHK